MQKIKIKQPRKAHFEENTCVTPEVPVQAQAPEIKKAGGRKLVIKVKSRSAPKKVCLKQAVQNCNISPMKYCLKSNKNRETNRAWLESCGLDVRAIESGAPTSKNRSDFETMIVLDPRYIQGNYTRNRNLLLALGGTPEAVAAAASQYPRLVTRRSDKFVQKALLGVSYFESPFVEIRAKPGIPSGRPTVMSRLLADPARLLWGEESVLFAYMTSEVLALTQPKTAIPKGYENNVIVGVQQTGAAKVLAAGRLRNRTVTEKLCAMALGVTSDDIQNTLDNALTGVNLAAIKQELTEHAQMLRQQVVDRADNQPRPLYTNLVTNILLPERQGSLGLLEEKHKPLLLSRAILAGLTKNYGVNFG